MSTDTAPSRLHPLGRNLYHDPRSRAYRYRGDHTAAYRTVMHPPTVHLDQGDIGSCTGHAAAHLLSTAEHGSWAATEDDAQNLYHLATTLDTIDGTWKPDDTGSTGLAVAKAAQQVKRISGYQHVLSLADGLAALQQRAQITGVNWYSSFDSPDPTTGLVTIGSGAYVRGGHEFCVFGHDTDKGLIWAQNSWGLGWGVQGRFCFTVATWAQLLAQKGDATVFTPADQPPPTPDPGGQPTDVDRTFASRYAKWRKGVTSKFTQAGRLADAGDALMAEHPEWSQS